VSGLDHHRVSESEDRVAKRTSGLDAAGEAYLRRFGYPYVLERWRFRMTLSERLAAPYPIEAAALHYFGAALQACTVPRVIESVAIYRALMPGAAFEPIALIPLDRP